MFQELVPGGGPLKGERKYLSLLSRWGSLYFGFLSSLFLHSLPLQSFPHSHFRHETLCVGNTAPSPPFELRGICCDCTRYHSSEAGSCEEGPRRCLRRSGCGCPGHTCRYAVSHNHRHLQRPIASHSVGVNVPAGHLNLCLCLSALPGFLDSNPVAKNVINGVGRDNAHDYFAGLVSGSYFVIPRPVHCS